MTCLEPSGLNSTAIHEAGHAMLFDAAGVSIECVTIESETANLEGYVKTKEEHHPIWVAVPGTLTGPAASFFIANERLDRDLQVFPSDRRVLIEIHRRFNSPDESLEQFFQRLEILLEGWARTWVTSQSGPICEFAKAMAENPTLCGSALQDALAKAWNSKKPETAKFQDELQRVVHHALNCPLCS